MASKDLEYINSDHYILNGVHLTAFIGPRDILLPKHGQLPHGYAKTA
jgi:hypothetical protein